MNPAAKDFQQVLSNLKDFDPLKLTQEVVAAGEDWADKDAAASSYEETRKSLLARLTLEQLAGGYTSGGAGEKPKSIPMNQAEIRALADERYEMHLELMVTSRKESNRARVRYDLGKMRLELMRTVQATWRNEMRLAGAFN